MKTLSRFNSVRVLRRLGAAMLFSCRTGRVRRRAAHAEPLVTPQWLNGHRAGPDLVVLDIRSAIDGGGAQAYAAGHIPGSVHSDYDKAGWRVTRNDVPFMVPTTAGARKADRRSRHRRKQPRRGGAGRRERARFRLGRAHLLDAEICRREERLDPRRRYRRLAAGSSADSKADANAPSPKIFTATLDKSILALASDVENIEGKGGATLVDARPASFFLGKEKAPASQAYGHIPGALNIDSAEFYDPKTNRLKPKAELAAIANAVPAGARW